MPSQNTGKTTKNRNKRNSSKYEQLYSGCFPNKCLCYFSINEAVFNYLFPYYLARSSDGKGGEEEDGRTIDSLQEFSASV